MIATLPAYTTFAVDFVTRPLGGVIFGHFGDKLGRKSMLILTLTIIGVATFLIGLVPTYEQIGVWAPIARLLLRVAQGIGLALGLCLASGVVARLSSLLSDEQFLSWGWRVAFLLSGLMVFVGMYIRLAVKETPEFAAAKARNEASAIPFVDMMRRCPANIHKRMGARGIDGVFSIAYLTTTLKVSDGKPWDAQCLRSAGKSMPGRSSIA